MSQITDPPAVLDYAKDPRRARRRRWIFRAASVLAIISLLVVSKPHLQALFDHAAEMYWANQCARFTAAADTPIWVTDSAKFEELKNHPDYAVLADPSRPNAQALTLLPYCWQRFAPLSSAPYFRAPHVKTLFLHELKTPAGKRRVVFIESRQENAMVLPYGLVATVIEPPTWKSGSRVVASPPDPIATFGPSLHAKLSFGQLDPGNPSHFTIEWKLDDVDPDGKPLPDEGGVIDGYLGDDDQIRFERRSLAPKPHEWIGGTPSPLVSTRPSG